MVCCAQPARESGTRSGHGRRQAGMRLRTAQGRQKGRTRGPSHGSSRQDRLSPLRVFGIPYATCWGPECVRSALPERFEQGASLVIQIPQQFGSLSSVEQIAFCRRRDLEHFVVPEHRQGTDREPIWGRLR